VTRKKLLEKKRKRLAINIFDLPSAFSFFFSFKHLLFLLLKREEEREEKNRKFPNNKKKTL